MKKLLTIVNLWLLASLFAACVHNPYIPNMEQPAAACFSDTVVFSLSNDVRPIFTSNGCMGCHLSSVAQTSGGRVDLEQYNSLKVLAGNGKLLCSVKHGNNCVAMPYLTGTKIDSCAVQTIEVWVNAGALNN